MANNIALQTLLAEELDKVLVGAIKSSGMEANAAGIKYNGGNKFQFAKMSFGDVSDLDYNRNTGFANGAVNVEYETKEFKKDWGKSFLIDAMDVDETNFIATATNALGEFERTVLAPAVDKFRFEEIVTLADANNKISYVAGYTGLRNAIKLALTDTGLSESDLVAYMTRSAYEDLVTDNKFTKFIKVDGGTGVINANVTSVDGVEIIVVDDSRLTTAKFIVCDRKAPIAIVKHQISRIFTPEENQSADAYKINVRIYHTLEIKDNELPAVVVATTA